MNFITDENIDFPIREELVKNHFSVYSIRHQEPGIDDEEIIQRANEQEAIIITNDTDFGELAYRQKLNHRGVILIRLEGLSNQLKTQEVLNAILREQENLLEAFTVISPGYVRIRKTFDDKQDEE